jgi:hypothetical protein
MSRKSRERRKGKFQGEASPEGKPPATPEALKRRRNRRFLFVGLIGLSFPIIELIAYQFRAITITFVNRSDDLVKKIKVTYSGGEFDEPELKPGGSISRRIRPDFTFKGEHFSTYTLTIRFAAVDGLHSQIGRAGTLDYSAQEIYTITQAPPEGRIQLQHTNRPGFPLSLVRDLMERLGFG